MTSSRRTAANRIVTALRDAAVGKKLSLPRQDLVELFDLGALGLTYRRLSQKHHEGWLRDVLGLTDARLATIRHVVELYDALLACSSDQRRLAATQRLMAAIGELIDVAEVSSVTQAGVRHLVLRFRSPPLECQQGDLHAFCTRGELPAQEIHHVISVIESLPPEHLRKVAYVLALAPEDEEDARVATLTHLAREAPYRLVVLSSRDLARVVLSPRPHAEMASIAGRHLDLLDVQPYRTHGSTTSSMFFGRKREIDRMLDDLARCFAIYGGRQVGKTSLLRRIQSLLDQQSGERTAFITCEGIDDSLALGREILKQLRVSTAQVRTVPDFERALRDHLRNQRVHHTVFIDEVDDLIDTDRTSPFKIFVALRNLHNDLPGSIRFFFAGFKKLYSEFNREYAPFTNLAEPHALAALPRRDAIKLIEEPVSVRLGIEIRDKERLLGKIYDYTGGHPCFIQQFCKCLIERIADDERATGGRMVITDADVEHVYGTDAYRNLVLRNYSDNFREGEQDGDILPKLIVTHVVFEDLDNLTEAELHSSLRASGIDLPAHQLRAELSKLTMTGVLLRNAQRYSFTNSAYPRLLRESETLDDILLQLTERYRRRADQERLGKSAAAPPAGGGGVVIRGKLLEQVLTDSAYNYAIVGGAGLGKSAFLRNLYETYAADLTAKPAHIATASLSTAREVLDSCLDWFGAPPEGGGQGALRERIASENQRYRRIVLLIDDVDQITAHDAAGLSDLLRFFGELSDELAEGFRVVVTGGFRLSALIDRAPPPSLERLVLRSLDDRDSRRLLVHLLEQRNLEVADETLLDLIVEYAGGNPQLLGTLTRLLDAEAGPVHEAHVRHVAESDRFRRTVLSVYEHGLSRREQRVVEALARSGHARLTPAAAAAQTGASRAETEEVLRDLTLLGVLKRLGSTYRFANDCFCECLEWRQHHASSNETGS